jgi:hypothetical protein
MRKKQISIRDVPEALYEWIESERHAKCAFRSNRPPVPG